MTYWLAVLAYLLPTFPLGYFWHLKTFRAQYDSLGLYRDSVVIPMGLAAMILQGLIFAWAYPRLFDRADWLASGLGFAAIFGILGWSFMVLPVAAKYRMASVRRFIALETGFTVLQYLVCGLLIALVYRA